MNQLDMKGRMAVVTGAAAGIGQAIAARLAASGARVCLWDRDRNALETAREALGKEHHGIALDVSSESDVAAATAATMKALGRIDILVCSAGITGPNMHAVDYPLDDWQQVLDINLTGVFLCSRAVAPKMRDADYGRIVNIASIAGKEGNPNASAYSASKAGVIALTKSLGKELAKTGVRVNCVTPAAVKTGDLRPDDAGRISTSCCRRSRWAASARSRRSPRWSPGCAPRSARFRPARCSIFPAAERCTDGALSRR